MSRQKAIMDAGLSNRYCAERAGEAILLQIKTQQKDTRTISGIETLQIAIMALTQRGRDFPATRCER